MFYSFKFAGTALVGSLAMGLVCVFAPLPAQIAVLGVCVSVLAGLFLAYVDQEDVRETRRAELLERLRIPIALAPEHDLFDQYASISESLNRLARQSDPVLREFALVKLVSISEQVASLAEGEVVFASTEAWRTVYEQILRSLGHGKYRSVALVRTGEYWQDEPGKKSMRLNYELQRYELYIERIVILSEPLWPRDALLPTDAIRPWIEEQERHGLHVSLVREGDLASEPDLVCDFGLYENRAVGIQELDDRSRTLRFTLQFDPQNLKLAEERWRRISMYAVSFSELLDRSTPRA